MGKAGEGTKQIQRAFTAQYCPFSFLPQKPGEIRMPYGIVFNHQDKLTGNASPTLAPLHCRLSSFSPPLGSLLLTYTLTSFTFYSNPEHALTGKQAHTASVLSFPLWSACCEFPAFIGWWRDFFLPQSFPSKSTKFIALSAARYWHMITIVSLVYRAIFGEGIKELGKERERGGTERWNKTKKQKRGYCSLLAEKDDPQLGACTVQVQVCTCTVLLPRW